MNHYEFLQKHSVEFLQDSHHHLVRALSYLSNVEKYCIHMILAEVC